MGRMLSFAFVAALLALCSAVEPSFLRRVQEERNLFGAFGKGDINDVRIALEAAYLKGADPTRTFQGYTVIDYALSKGIPHVVPRLIGMGARASHRDTYGRNAYESMTYEGYSIGPPASHHGVAEASLKLASELEAIKWPIRRFLNSRGEFCGVAVAFADPWDVVVVLRARTKLFLAGIPSSQISDVTLYSANARCRTWIIVPEFFKDRTVRILKADAECARFLFQDWSFRASPKSLRVPPKGFSYLAARKGVSVHRPSRAHIEDAMRDDPDLFTMGKVNWIAYRPRKYLDVLSVSSNPQAFDIAISYRFEDEDDDSIYNTQILPDGTITPWIRSAGADPG